MALPSLSRMAYFYPRPPRGGRQNAEVRCNRAVLFLSTPSARRATFSSPRSYRPTRISIHALREEGDLFLQIILRLFRISIHALREEGDLTPDGIFGEGTEFLSTPSARRATRQIPLYLPWQGISIHALREEGDLSNNKDSFCYKQFLSTPSARRATWHRRRTAMSDVFLSTPSARRATAKTETKSLFSNKLYNILHEFRRALIYNGSKSYPNHAK